MDIISIITQTVQHYHYTYTIHPITPLPTSASRMGIPIPIPVRGRGGDHTFIPLLVPGQGRGPRGHRRGGGNSVRGREEEEAEGVLLGRVRVEVEERGAVPDQVLGDC